VKFMMLPHARRPEGSRAVLRGIAPDQLGDADQREEGAIEGPELGSCGARLPPI
jgi:hypothetical protein